MGIKKPNEMALFKKVYGDPLLYYNPNLDIRRNEKRLMDRLREQVAAKKAGELKQK